MALGKEELLAAIAAAGSAGRAAYDQAQAQIAQQQKQAVAQALASGVAGNAPAGAQEQLAGIISQPYQNRTAQITSNRATMDDWYNRQSAMQGTYLDTALRLAELQAAGLGGGSGGGGGGGGGRGGGGDDDPFDWEGALSDKWGTTERGFDGIWNEAKALGLNSVQNPDLPRYQQTRAYATSAYGVPEGVAEIEFGPTKFQSAAETLAPNLANFKNFYKSNDPKDPGAIHRPGNQTGPVNTLISRMKPKQAKQARKIIKKTRRNRGR